MDNKESIKIIVAESSVIIRSGVVAVLKRLPNLNIHPIEVASREALQNCIGRYQPNIVIVDPTLGGWLDIDMLRSSVELQNERIKYVALLCSVVDQSILKEYDESFSIRDDSEVLAAIINKLTSTDEPEELDSELGSLSMREKEIITCVVKGMTNKAIADKLFISIHTVVTHRRNIAKKLQIHSSAGLTIYAIVNKLVELDEIKDSL